MAETVRQRLLGYLIQRLGRAEAANRLKATEDMLEAWHAGHATMPNRKLLVLADLIDELDDEKPRGT